MRNMLQMVGGVAAAGVVAAGATAFTAPGLKLSQPTQAVSPVGTVVQSVTSGLNISGIVYTYADNTSTGSSFHNQIKKAVITFDTAVTNTVTVAATSTTGGGFGISGADSWVCTASTVVVGHTNDTWTCQTEDSNGTPGANVGYFAGVDTFAVTVA
ncbi:hypothetical protein [Actinoplanes sp. HUAS TT8]|uniref:hypothetical protein n=1 Tax=Actinoplanes sp. HUAS TT8 TaxID=3447453 RepID=UPI003F51CDC5